jgi:hypothetical protein
MIMDELKARGISDQNILHYNFDSLKYDDIKDAKSIYKEIQSKLALNGKTYLFLDEIQEIRNWEKAVNSFMNDFDVDIYVTGSNSRMMSSEISTYLTGRYVSFRVFPLSFAEYLSFKKTYTAVASPHSELANYLMMGGFPAIHLRAYTQNEAYTIVRDKTYTKSDFLNEVYLSDEQYDTLCGLLARKKNIILQGAPGVGKTFAAKRLAYSIMGEKDDSRIRIVQFHQSYSYEDFVLGYRPNEVGFSLETGLFYDFCKTAGADPDRDYYFIVDEINRGNLSKIFGELLMLIESDKRGPLYAVQLAYHSDELDRRFYVPDNLYIIGMMNTADRSLATIDYALRRRFAFFTMLPNFKGIPSQSSALMKVIAEVEVINVELTKELGSGFQIGHSYFIGKDNASVSDSQLRPIVEFELIPLLQEYYFDDEPRLNDAVLKLRNALQ